MSIDEKRYSLVYLCAVGHLAGATLLCRTLARPKDLCTGNSEIHDIDEHYRGSHLKALAYAVFAEDVGPICQIAQGEFICM